MKITFVASFSPIVRDLSASRSFYQDTLGLTFEGHEGDYTYTEKLEGVKHFGMWPLADAAESCFGARDWPEEVPVPQASVEFELQDLDAVAAAARELEARGYKLIHGSRTEPWNQTIARLLSPEGLLVGVCYTPWFH